jgi:hypothetical protein
MWMDEGRRRESAVPVGVWWWKRGVYNLSEIEEVGREKFVSFFFLSNEDKKFVLLRQNPF